MISLFLSVAVAAELGRSSSVTPSTRDSAFETPARDVQQFARDMQIDPHFKIKSYFRADKSSFDLQAKLTTFTCKGGFTVTLIPMIHVADRSYFEKADELAGRAEMSLEEGVVRPGFYGPPFEKDDRLQTVTDFENRTRDRLMTISDGLAKYRAKFHKTPTSIFDFAAGTAASDRSRAEIEEGAKSFLFDTWGRPFQFKSLSNGSVEVSSLGEDGTGRHAVTILNTATEAPKPDDSMDELVASYRAKANSVGLVFQGDVKTKTNLKKTTKDTDVSRDMLLDPTSLQLRVLSNRLRNVGPIMKIDDILSSSNDYHPKSYAITYGAAHMPKFEQYLTGGKFQCKQTSEVWQTVVSGPFKIPGLTDDQRAHRFQYVNDLAALPQTLEPDPLGLEDQK